MTLSNLSHGARSGHHQPPLDRPDPRAARAPEPRASGGIPRRVHDAVVLLQRFARRRERWWRPGFDALFARPLEAVAQALLRRYHADPGLWIAEERLLPDEDRIADEIAETMSRFLAEHYRGKIAERAGNTKTYGLIRGTFEVLPQLPAELRVGVFREPRSFPVWVRCAGPGPLVAPDLEDNGVLSLAIKLMDVPGDKLSADERQTQDFLFISAPTFTTPNAAENLKLQREIGRGRPAWYFINPRDSHFLDALMQGLYSKSHPNPLELRYYSCVPFSFGNGRAVQYALSPVLPGRSRLPRRPGDDYLREAMVKTLSEREVCFDFTVQFQTDPRRMPIENASLAWPTRDSPRRPVARLVLPRQVFDSPAQLAFARNLRFDPWHALAEHRPLGNQNRVRRKIYRATADKRQSMNAEHPIEPTGDERF